MSSGILILVRHGESLWNATGQWTGKTNIGLSDKGKIEAEKMGTLLKDIHFDRAFISSLDRTHQTFQGLEQGHSQKNIFFSKSSALDERDYGIYTSKNKWEIKEKVGEKAFTAIRRGWDTSIPEGESLKMVYERVLPFYLEKVVPFLQKEENILIVAHGNSLRALMKYIELLSDEEIGETEFLLGTAILYTVDSQGHRIKKEIRRL